MSNHEKDFGNSALGRGLAVAALIMAVAIGLSLILNSCATQALNCEKAGGSWDGNSGSCTNVHR